MGLDMYLSVIDLDNVSKEEPFTKEEVFELAKHIPLYRKPHEFDLLYTPIIKDWLNNKDIANLTEDETRELIELIRTNNVIDEFKDYWSIEFLLKGLLDYKENKIKELHNILRYYDEYTQQQSKVEDFDKKLDRYRQLCDHIYGNEVADFYWRKFNALHLWFVKHAQNGSDECMSYPVSLETLKELRGILETIDALARNEDDIEKPSEHSIDIASSLLPTGSGFFFGSTDYDKWYFNDASEALAGISDAIRLLEAKDSCVAIYQSSW